MDEEPHVRARCLVELPAIHGLAQVHSSVAHPKDVASEVLGGLRGKSCQASVVLVVVAVHKIVYEGAEVCFGLPHGRRGRPEGV